MRKLLVLVLAMVLSGAFAQGRLFGEVARNMSLISGFGLNLQVQARMGAENVLGPLALRGAFGLATSSDGTAFAIGADAIYFLRSGSPDFYFGGGLGLETGATALFSLNFNAGVEIPMARVNFFVELQPALLFAGGASQFALSLEFGPRLYFH